MVRFYDSAASREKILWDFRRKNYIQNYFVTVVVSH